MSVPDGSCGRGGRGRRGRALRLAINQSSFAEARGIRDLDDAIAPILASTIVDDRSRFEHNSGRGGIFPFSNRYRELVRLSGCGHTSFDFQSLPRGLHSFVEVITFA